MAAKGNTSMMAPTDRRRRIEDRIASMDARLSAQLDALLHPAFCNGSRTSSPFSRSSSIFHALSHETEWIGKLIQ